MRKSHIRPIARSSSLVVEHLGDETLVYDRIRHKAHCLNPSASYVWRRSTGEATVEEIAGGLPNAVGLPEDPRIAMLALQRLWSARLLAEPVPAEITHARIGRRELVRTLARAGISTAVLPVVASIISPRPVLAASCGGLLAPCNAGKPCCPGVGLACVLGVCTNI